jgi:hypothetical protein
MDKKQVAAFHSPEAMFNGGSLYEVNQFSLTIHGALYHKPIFELFFKPLGLSDKPGILWIFNQAKIMSVYIFGIHL